MSDASHSNLQASSQDLLTGNRGKPPPPLSVIGQYSSVGRLPNDNSFSVAALFITAVVCLAIGVLAGFIGGYLISK